MFWSGEVHTSRLNHLRYDNSTWLNFKKQLQDGTLVEQVWHRHHNHPRAPPLSLLIKNQSLSMKMQVVWNTLNPSKTTLQRPSFYPQLPRNTQRWNLKHKDQLLSLMMDYVWLSSLVCVSALLKRPVRLSMCSNVCVCVYLLCPGLHQLSHLTTLKALAFLVARWNSSMMDIMIWKGGGTHHQKQSEWKSAMQQN